MLELLGKTLTLKEGTGKIGDEKMTPDVLSLSRRDAAALFAEHGVTEEVFDVIAQAEAAIVGAGLEIMQERCKETGGRPSVLKLPANPTLQIEAKLDPKVTRMGVAPNPNGGDPVPYNNTEYGRVTLHVRSAVPKVLQSDVIPGIAADMEKAFSKL